MLAAGDKPDFEFRKIDFQGAEILPMKACGCNMRMSSLRETPPQNGGGDSEEAMALSTVVTLLPPEFRDASNGARHKVLKLSPFNVAVQHPLIGSQGKIFTHVRS